MRLFRAGLRKLVRRPATFVTFGLLVGLLALIYLAVGRDGPAAAQRQRRGGGAPAGHVPGGLHPAALVHPRSRRPVRDDLRRRDRGLGMDVGHAEGRGRPRREPEPLPARCRSPRSRCSSASGCSSRSRSAWSSRSSRPASPRCSTEGIGDSATLGTLPELLGRGWLALAEACALGFTIATLARSQLAGIGVGIAVYFGEQFATIFLPDVVKYLPFHAATAVVAVSDSSLGGGGAAQAARLEPNTALVVVAAWLIGALIVTALFTERAEISG